MKPLAGDREIDASDEDVDRLDDGRAADRPDMMDRRGEALEQRLDAREQCRVASADDRRATGARADHAVADRCLEHLHLALGNRHAHPTCCIGEVGRQIDEHKPRACDLREALLAENGVLDVRGARQACEYDLDAVRRGDPRPG